MTYKNRENIYEVENGVVYVFDKMGNLVFFADAEDIPLFSMWSWHLDYKGYAVGGSGSNGKMYKAHKLIFQSNPGEVCDHISRNRKDNRKCNLRSVSYVENNRNRSLSVSNKSGRKGVFFDKRNHSWRAVIGVSGKNKYLGSYKTFEEALAARETAEILLDWNGVPK